MTPLLMFRRFGIAPDTMFSIEGWQVGSCAVQRFLPSHLPDCFVSVRLKVISLLVCSHASHVVGNALYLVSFFVTVSLSSHLTLCCLFWFSIQASDPLRHPLVSGERPCKMLPSQGSKKSMVFAIQ